MKWARPFAVCCACATTLFVIASAVEAVLAPTRSSVGWALVGGLTAALSSGLGLLITERARQAEVVGALLALVGVTLGFTAAREGLWEVLGRHQGAATSSDWLVALLAESSIWLIAAIALLLLVFPDGHLPSPRWRFAPPAVVAAAALHHAFGAVDSAPYQHPLQHLHHAFGAAPYSARAAVAARRHRTPRVARCCRSVAASACTLRRRPAAPPAEVARTVRCRCPSVHHRVSHRGAHTRSPELGQPPGSAPSRSAGFRSPSRSRSFATTSTTSTVRSQPPLHM